MKSLHNFLSYALTFLICSSSILPLGARGIQNSARRRTQQQRSRQTNRTSQRSSRCKNCVKPVSRQALRRATVTRRSAQNRATVARARAVQQRTLARRSVNRAVNAGKQAIQHRNQAQAARATVQHLELRKNTQSNRNIEQSIAQARQRALQAERARQLALAERQKAIAQARQHALAQKLAEAEAKKATAQAQCAGTVTELLTDAQLNQARISELETKSSKTEADQEEIHKLRLQLIPMIRKIDALQAKLPTQAGNPLDRQPVDQARTDAQLAAEQAQIDATMLPQAQKALENYQNAVTVYMETQDTQTPVEAQYYENQIAAMTQLGHALNALNIPQAQQPVPAPVIVADQEDDLTDSDNGADLVLRRNKVVTTEPTVQAPVASQQVEISQPALAACEQPVVTQPLQVSNSALGSAAPVLTQSVTPVTTIDTSSIVHASSAPAAQPALVACEQPVATQPVNQELLQSVWPTDSTPAVSTTVPASTGITVVKLQPDQIDLSTSTPLQTANNSLEASAITASTNNQPVVAEPLAPLYFNRRTIQLTDPGFDAWLLSLPDAFMSTPAMALDQQLNATGSKLDTLEGAESRGKRLAPFVAKIKTANPALSEKVIKLLEKSLTLPANISIDEQRLSALRALTNAVSGYTIHAAQPEQPEPQAPAVAEQSSAPQEAATPALLPAPVVDDSASTPLVAVQSAEPALEQDDLMQLAAAVDAPEKQNNNASNSNSNGNGPNVAPTAATVAQPASTKLDGKAESIDDNELAAMLEENPAPANKKPEQPKTGFLARWFSR